MNAPKPHTVLIVEDESLVADDLQHTLAGMGYEVSAIAASAEEAIARASEKCPDIVLMDIRIEGKRDGIETAELLRNTFGVPAVYLTAHADEAMIERAKRTEPYGYLIKPVQDAELRRVIDIAVYRREMEQARESTAQLELQQRSLAEAKRLKDEFLATMSHELRTPLNGIIGIATLMYEGAKGPVSEIHREYLNHVLTSGRRLLQLIDDVLALAALQAGAVDFHPQAIHLPRLLREVADPLRPLLTKKGLGFRIDIDPLCADVLGDPPMLQQLVNIYLSNAIKFTPIGGNVMLRATPEGVQSLRIEVVDTGIGVSAEDTGRLFLPFQQLDAGRRRKFEGAGLGLAIATRLAEAHGGSVGVESILGQGSTFFAVLPRARSVQPLPCCN
jgi:signal transduction histidine kinase